MNEVTINILCPSCGNHTTVTITEEEHERILNGDGHIQDILPHRSVEVRELFITGFCYDCQANIFCGDEEDDECFVTDADA